MIRPLPCGPALRYRDVHMSRQVFLRVVIATLGLVAIGMAPTAAPSPLRVGVSPDSPPMVFKQGQQVRGLEADLAAALGDALGRPVQFVERKWDALFPALEAGKIDIIMSAVSITRERQTQVGFCDPYLRTGQMALVRREDLNRYGMGFPDVLPGPVGVRRGTTGDHLVQQNYSKAKCRRYSLYEDGAKALLKKKIALFVGDGPAVWHLAGRYEAKGLAVVPIMMSSEQYGWAVRREDAELRRQVNSFLVQIRSNGELIRMMKTWLPAVQ